jgi:hypothetical protein
LPSTTAWPAAASDTGELAAAAHESPSTSYTQVDGLGPPDAQPPVTTIWPSMAPAATALRALGSGAFVDQASAAGS